MIGLKHFIYEDRCFGAPDDVTPGEKISQNLYKDVEITK